MSEPAQPPPSPGATVDFSVGGAVSGLTGTGLVLTNNGEDLAVPANGTFVFANRLASQATYDVAVKTQPSGQTCLVRNASGTIAGANVSNVEVSCTSGSSSQFSVGGTVAGLLGSGLTVQLNGSNDVALASNGRFTFEPRLASGTPYQVTVSRQPSNPGQVCTVAGASGTVGDADITSVRVTCASNTFRVGGVVSGLLGSRMVLRNNGGDDLTVDSNGSFAFSTRLASGATYNVTVHTQPSDPVQACTVGNARGTVQNGDVTSITVNCTTSDVTIGGTVSGLSGSGLVLRNNGGDDLTINDGGRFTFDTTLPTGASYNVSVAQQPTDPDQTCVVSNGSGIVGSSNVTNVAVRCERTGFLVRGRVRGLRGSGLVLQNNGGDNLAIASNGSFAFSTPIQRGGSYNVTVAQQPANPRQTCEVRDGSGSVEDRDIDDVEVRCDRDDDD